MVEVFKAKVRRVGTSLGLLIPKDVVEKEEIKLGEEVKTFVLKERDLGPVLKLRGAAKGWKPFIRDRTDRLERYEKEEE